jgi:hypothetical protein
VYDYARQWIEASHACIYHLLYLCTWTWIRVTTQMSFLRLISRVAPNPSPPIPELVTWFRAVSWKNFFFISLVQLHPCFTLDQKSQF